MAIQQVMVMFYIVADHTPREIFPLFAI